MQQLKFFFKLTHKDLPEYFNAISLIQVGDIHDHITRNRKKITLKGFIINSPKKVLDSICHTLNDAPELIRNKIDTHSFQGFSNYTKTFFLRKYSDQCQIANCCLQKLSFFVALCVVNNDCRPFIYIYIICFMYMYV